jgi:uncharacterized protein YoxC
MGETVMERLVRVETKQESMSNTLDRIEKGQENMICTINTLTKQVSEYMRSSEERFAKSADVASTCSALWTAVRKVDERVTSQAIKMSAAAGAGAVFATIIQMIWSKF